jgi:hypothetical protein
LVHLANFNIKTVIVVQHSLPNSSELLVGEKGWVHVREKARVDCGLPA